MASGLLAGGNPMFGITERGIYFFTLDIHYYALVIVTGMIIAACLSALLMKRRNMSPDFVFTLFVFCIPTAIIGARLFSCLTDPNLGIQALFQFPWAGLSITGGVIGGVGAGFVVCRVKKISFLRAADCVVITILLAQALGRWGNFFNKEVYGGAVADPSMQWFPFAVPVSPNPGVFGIGSFSDPSSTWHYAFFFYESLINLIGFSLLYSAAWFWTKKPNGIFVCAYFVWYGTVRSIMEPLRDPEFILDGGGVMWSEVFAITMAVGGLLGIAVLLIINYKKEGALFGSKSGDPCGITLYLSPYKNDKPYFSKINILGANYPPAPEQTDSRSFKEKSADLWHSVKAKFKGKSSSRGDEPPAPENDPVDGGEKEKKE